LKKLLSLILLLALAFGIYGAYKPLPKGLNLDGQVYNVPESSVEFLYDVTYLNKDGQRESKQEIFDEIFKMVKGAKKFVLLDMFLFNDFQGKKSENHRKLSGELTELLIKKKKADPKMEIIVVSDPVNTIYGGYKSPHFSKLEEARVKIIITDLKKLRDTNPVYSGFYRSIFQWFGNKDEGGRFANPFDKTKPKVTARSYLEMVNFKANHRKLIVADAEINGKLKMAALITSANPHDGSSAHSNSAIKINDFIWSDVIKSEEAAGKFSGANFTASISGVSDESGNIKVKLLTEKKIRGSFLNLVNGLGKSDSIDMAMFYLSERKIVEALKMADKNGADIRIILDPNKDAFGREKNGVPNRPVADELFKNTKGNTRIRWCDTHGEQCHSKMTLIKNSSGYHLLLGSANLTRRNIGNYNLETDALIESDKKIGAINRAYEFFNESWENKNGKIYTADYEKYKDESLYKMVWYRLAEATGMSSF
jgi:hypothetical protein